MQLRTIDGHDLATAESSFRRPVAIVVLAWNGLAYTRKCLDSITRTLGGRHRIIVVDNGSTDGTVEYLRAQTGIQTVLNSSNLGYAAGNNLGLQLLDLSEDVVLLNNDTELRQGNWLELLQEAAYSSDKVGIVGCRLVRPDGMLQHVGVYMPLDSLWGQQIGAHERDVGQFSSTREVESVVFACVYIKRTVIDVVGRLDEDYFSYFEDTDYCLRAREKGFKILCCGSATVVHHENVSTTLNAVPHEKMFRKARSVFRAKWDERLRNTRYDRKLSWHSLFNFPSGYAISSRELAVALDSLGVWVSYKYVYGPGTVFPVQEKELNENFRGEMIRSRPWDPGDMQVVYGQGDVFRSNSGRYKIGFTMLETDRIPDEWVRQANRMDEVWVPSTFNVDTFRRSGVIRPLHVVPLGVDPGYFNPDIHRRPLTGLYTFLSIFEWGERKAPEMLLQAFNDEFSADEPVVRALQGIEFRPGRGCSGMRGSLALKPAGGSIHISLNQVTPTYQLGACTGQPIALFFQLVERGGVCP